MSNMLNQKGDISLIAILICISFLITGTVLYKVCLNNTRNRIYFEEEKRAISAAEIALRDFEYLLKEKSTESFDKLKDFQQDNSKKWFLSSNTSKEERIKIEDTEYSLELLNIFPSRNYTLLKVKSYGYSKNFKKIIIAQYKIEGIALISSAAPQYSLYIASDGYDFNQKVKIIGDVYFGGGFRFNANASGSIIEGNLKTGSSNITSEFNGRVTVTGKAFFQTPVKVQNDSLIFNSKAGFLKNCEFLKAIAIEDKGFFSSSITGKVDMRGNEVVHKGSCSPSSFSNASKITVNSSLNIANELNMIEGKDDPIKFNIDNIYNKAVDFSSLGITELTGKNLQTAYELNKDKRWNDYLIVKITNNKIPQFNKTDGVFKGKVIFIVETNLPVNGRWYESDANSETIIYVKKGTIFQLGWNSTMNGIIYVSDQGDIQYSFNKDSKLNGFICHVNNAGFQANTSNMVTIEYPENYISLWSSLGIITLPSFNVKENFSLIDLKIRPVLLSNYLN